MPPSPAVRPRTSADLATCLRVLADVHRADGYPLNWPSDPASWLSPDGLREAWVATTGGSVVGHAALGDATGGLAPLSRLFVAPSARGDGVVTALVDAAVAAAQATGARLVLEVVEGSAAVGLYERLGWRLVDRRPTGWTAPDGREPTSRVYLSPRP